MKAEEFLKSVETYKGKNVFLFYGEQGYLIDECISKLEALFGVDDMSLTRFEGSYNSSEVINVLQSISFFCEYSVAVADSLPDGENAEKLLAFLDNAPEHAKMIFAVKGTIDKRKSFVKKLLKIAVEVTAQEDADVVSWVVQEGKKNKINLDKTCAELMIQLAGQDMYTLKNEINKLSFLGKENISRQDILDNVSKGADYNIFLLNTLMLEGKYAEAFCLADEIIRQEKTAIPLIALLSNRFYQMYLARCCLDAGMRPDQAAAELQKSAKMNRFASKFIIKDAQHFSAHKLKSSVKLLADYDFALKSGGVDEGIAYILTKLYVEE